MLERDTVHVWFRDFAAGSARGRNLVRDVLGEQVPLAEDPSGKPRVAGADLGFSVSHSGAVAVVAVAAGLDVGVDVERVREVRRAERIALRWLATGDARAVAAAPAEDRARTFLRAWVAAEALAKGWGGGIGDLARVREGLREPAADRGRSHVAGPGGEPWSVVALEAPRGYIAALAAPGADWKVVVH